MARVNPDSPANWSKKQTYERMWQIGDLRFLTQQHQREVYDHFHCWNHVRNTPEHQQLVRELGALYDNVFMFEIARRFGKTAVSLILAVEAAIRMEDSRGLFFTSKKEYITDIYVPLAKEVFGDTAPPGYEPVYHGSKSGTHEGFHIEATGSYIKLVGVDVNPEATRGQFQDFIVGTEAAFVKGLADTWRSTLTHQLQKRPHAWCLFESSTAKVKDSDFSKVFRPDCLVRGSYIKRTINDNSSLSDEEKEKEIRRSGGIEHVDVRRELFCEEVRDESQMVVPEFDEGRDVIDESDCPIPESFHAYVGMDPGGKRDPLGLVFFYVDFLRQLLVVQASLMLKNKSTADVADAIKDMEARLWGTKAKKPKPHRDDILDMLKPQPQPEDADETWELEEVQHILQPRSTHILEQPSGTKMYWSDVDQSYRYNPLYRTMDVAPQQQLDMQVAHDLAFVMAKKGPDSADQHLSNLRKIVRDGKFRIIRNGLTNDIIMQLRSGEWNEQRTDWVRSPVLGHLDCIAALQYAARFVDWKKNPYAPRVKDINAPNVHVSRRYREAIESVAPQASGKLSERAKANRFQSGRSGTRFGAKEAKSSWK